MNKNTIITYKELEHKQYNNEKIYVDTIKYTLKNLKLDYKGKKKELIERLSQYYKLIHYYSKHINTIIFIQTKMKRTICNKCVNVEDFYTLDKLTDIEPTLFFSYVDHKNFRYGFDIRSLKKLVMKSTINPYTRFDIPKNIIERINNKIKTLETLQVNTTIEAPVELSEKQRIKNRVIDLFEKIDSLNILSFGADINWFIKLNFNSLKKLYRAMEDIWNYRVQISMVEKCKIVPTNNIFQYNINYIQNMLPENNTILKTIILDEMNKLVSGGIDIENKKTGSYYVLIALTEVSPECAESIPWLAQSNY